MKMLHKMLIAPAIAVALLALVALAAIWGLAYQEAALKDLSSNHLRNQRDAGTARYTLALLKSDLYRLFNLLQNIDEKRLQSDLKRINSQLQELAEFVQRADIPGSGGDDALRATTVEEINKFKKMANDAIDMASVDPNTGLALLMSADQQHQAAAAALDKLGELIDANAANLVESVKSRTLWLLVAVGVFSLLSAIAALALSVAIARRSVAALVSTSKSAQQLAAGDLSAEFFVRGTDEVAQLAQSLESMRRSLTHLISNVRASVQQVNVASREMAAGGQDLSSRTEQQASSLQQTASSMEEITSTIRQSAENARLANQTASIASTVAAKGGSAFNDIVAMMGDISAQSHKISEIIGIIDEIAFQTNILALNAAVEAARAGEQGRGFAVVAAEVRALAQRSAQSARQISGLISASVERVEAGNNLVQQAGSTMHEILDQVNRVTTLISEISNAIMQQSSGIGQVNQAVSQLDRMTQQNAALVEQSAATAMSLREQATRLDEAVATFTVPS